MTNYQMGVSHSESATQHALSQKAKKEKLQTYNNEYIKLGFVECSTDVNQPQCLVCYKIFSNEGIRSAKLKQHLTTYHPELTGKLQTFSKKRKSI